MDIISIKAKKKRNSKIIGLSHIFISSIFVFMILMLMFDKPGNTGLLWKILHYKIGETSPVVVFLLFLCLVGIFMYLNEKYWRPYYVMNLVWEDEKLWLELENDGTTYYVLENIDSSHIEKIRWNVVTSIHKLSGPREYVVYKDFAYLLTLKSKQGIIVILDYTFTHDVYEAPANTKKRLKDHDYVKYGFNDTECPGDFLKKMNDMVRRFSDEKKQQ